MSVLNSPTPASDLRSTTARPVITLEADLAGLSVHPQSTDRKGIALLESQRRAEIVDRCKSEQCVHFERARPAQNLIFLADIKNPELRAKVWRSLPASKFKRFQAAFCEPIDFVVPEFSHRADGKIAFRSDVDVQSLSTVHAIVSPLRISDTLVENLKLVQIKKSDTDLDVLEKKASQPVIQTLKAWWDAAQPPAIQVLKGAKDGPNFRILVLNDLSEEIRERFPQAVPLDRDFKGSLLYTSGDSNPSAQRTFSGLKVSFFPTAYEGYRKTLHAGRGYEKEQEALATLLSKVLEAKDVIETKWRQDLDSTTKSALRESVAATIAEGLEILEKAINPQKKKAKTYLEHCREVRDCLGRINPQATKASLLRAISNLSRRLEETVAKNSYNERDKNLLLAAANADATILKGIREGIARNASELFSKSELISSNAALLRLSTRLSSLDAVTCRPFSTYAALMKAHTREFARGWDAGRKSDAKCAVIKMYVTSKLFAANVIVEAVKKRLVDHESVSMDAITEDLGNIRKVFQIKVFPSIRMTDYEKAFWKLTQQIKAFEKVVAGYPKGGSPDDRLAFREALREKLDEAMVEPPEVLAQGLLDRVPAAYRV